MTHLMTISLGPVIGVTVGVAAAIYPAWRAANIEPAVAVRHTA